eukprot:UN06977
MLKHKNIMQHSIQHQFPNNHVISNVNLHQYEIVLQHHVNLVINLISLLLVLN